MTQNNFMRILTESCLMQTEEQATNFEHALTAIAKAPDENNLSAYHLILDVQCEQPEVMFVWVNSFPGIFLYGKPNCRTDSCYSPINDNCT